jgi:hypothetical protein
MPRQEVLTDGLLLQRGISGFCLVDITPEMTPADAAAGTPMPPADIAPAPESASAELGTACAAAWKPILEWAPSQNGFFVEAPQRQSAVLSWVGKTFPLASRRSIVPVCEFRSIVITDSVGL